MLPGLQLLLGVGRQIPRQLRQDLRAGLDQDPPHLLRSQRRVVLHRVAGEVLEFAQRLHARVPGPDEDERERGAASSLVVGLGGDVQLRQHVVAQVDRLLHGLEPDPPLGESGHRQHARPRPRRHHQDVVAERHRGAVGDRHRRRVRLVIDRHDLTDGDRRVSQQRPQRHHGGAGVDRAAGHFRQERLVLHEVVRAHQGDVVARLRQRLHVEGRLHAGEAAADDQDALAGFP